MISTRSPLLNSVLRAAGSWLTFAAIVELPTSVCTAYAKSMVVAPRGSEIIFPFGVNTNTSSGNKSSFRCSKNSAALPGSDCNCSKFCIH